MACVNEGSHSFTCHPHVYPQVEPAIERVQALADISCSGYDVIATKPVRRTPIANPPNNAQIEGISYHSSKLHPGPCSNVGVVRGTHRHADARDQSRGLRLARNVMNPASPAAEQSRVDYGPREKVG